MTDFESKDEYVELVKEAYDEELLVHPEIYDTYLQICEDNNISPADIPTYQEWCELVGADEDTRKKLGFVINPAALPAAIGAGAAGIGAAKSILTQLGVDANTQDEYINQAASELRKQAIAQARRTGSKIMQNFGNRNNDGGGDGGTSQSNYMGGSSWNPTGLSLKNKPINVSFDADIRFIGADKYFLDGAEANTPLLLKCGLPGLILHNTDGREDTQLENYFLGPIVNCYQRAIAERVTFSNVVMNEFTAEKVRKYINNSLQACATYYFWMSILAYTADSRNKNGAMQVLSNSLTAEEKNNLIILKQALEKAVIPPFIHKWAFYIMGNFKQSHVPGAPLIKFMPWFFKTTTTAVFTEMGEVTQDGKTYGSITSAIQNINDIKGMYDILGAAFPDWTNMELYEYTSSPEVDMNFCNVWCNGYYKTTRKSTAEGFKTITLPDVGTDMEKEIVWNSQTDAPRGWTQAMQCVSGKESSTATTTKILPGFFSASYIEPDGSEDYAASQFILNSTTQSVTCYTTCLIYNGSTAGAEGFQDVSVLSKYQALAKNTYVTTHASTTVSSHQKYGCQLIKLQTIDTIRQACYKWLDLYTQDLKDAPLSSNWSKNSSKGKSKSRYSRGKSKMTEEKEES